MGREAQNLVLLFLGLTVGKTALDGTFERYVKPGLQPYLVVSAVVLVALALVAMARDIRTGGATAEDGAGHDHRPSRVLWLLTVPILVVFFLAPPALLPSSSGPSSNIAAAESVRFPPLPAGAAPQLSVYEVAQRATQPDGGGLSGRTITVDGYASPHDGHTEIAQVVIICCAADARTYRMAVAGPAAAQLAAAPPRTWWRVVGTVVDGSATPATGNVPRLQAERATQEAAPANTYGY
ncbi:TIGR03943 family protein [Gordonia sp. X0973]|uniref:TIGR03943 family putative permease subunit n=1 Tax=Gordonia sp. X0973 TaxID=2742602 RepID=UPI000F54218C|nr:TIGR03943 family protein [Gordonia sp. X0973]QKT08659.1 TIGR03943 family protein [Gordonia sp. X0973]